MPKLPPDDELRFIGAKNEAARAVVAVRAEIHALTAYQPIHPRHTRKQAARDAIVAPLRRLEAKFLAQAQRPIPS